MKKTFALLAGVTISFSSFAFEHLHMSTVLCNLTSHDLHFVKTSSYQANTDDGPSANQVIHVNNCADVNYWFEYQDDGYDNDDALQFEVYNAENSTDLGSFDIRAKQVFPHLSTRFTINNLSLRVYAENINPCVPGSIYNGGAIGGAKVNKLDPIQACVDQDGAGKTGLWEDTTDENGNKGILQFVDP